MILPCGCSLISDPASGVLRKTGWCPGHARQRRDPATLGEAYYRGLGLLDEDAPERYVGEMEDVLGPLPDARSRSSRSYALEVGCGCSPYARALIDRGWVYCGCEPSRWAVEWMRERLGMVTGRRAGGPWMSWGRLEDWQWWEDQEEEKVATWDLILAAHAFEHMDDAPAAIRRCADLLAPDGLLYAIVPDDGDPANPDHTWVFDRDTFAACLEAAGLFVELITTRRRVEKELFIYARARKP